MLDRELCFSGDASSSYSYNDGYMQIGGFLALASSFL